jgi:hypothetical protein
MPDLAVISFPVMFLPWGDTLKKMFATSDAMSNIIKLIVRSTRERQGKEGRAGERSDQTSEEGCDDVPSNVEVRKAILQLKRREKRGVLIISTQRWGEWNGALL